MTSPIPASAASSRSSPGRIPSLDGLRALSIALVVVTHASGMREFPRAVATVVQSRNLGDLGVRVFFVLSGLLITGLLVREQSERGRISLRRFYLRRTFRIFPPFYVYVGVIAVATLAGWIVMPRRAFFAAATYTVNYLGAPWDLGHAWTLSVEEQFYVLWPAVLVLFGRRRGLWAAIAFIVAAPLIRLGYDAHSAMHTRGLRFEAMGDAIAAGCVLALARDRLWANRWYRALLESRWIAVVPIVLALGIFAQPYARFDDAIGTTLVNLSIAILVDWCVRNPTSAVGRALNARPVVYVGVLSYSLYIWQQPFFMAGVTSAITIFPLNVALGVGCALASYYLVERPALRTRARVERWLDARASGVDDRGAHRAAEPSLAAASKQP